VRFLLLVITSPSSGLRFFLFDYFVLIDSFLYFIIPYHDLQDYFRFCFFFSFEVFLILGLAHLVFVLLDYGFLFVACELR